MHIRINFNNNVTDSQVIVKSTRAHTHASAHILPTRDITFSLISIHFLLFFAVAVMMMRMQLHTASQLA